MTLLKAFGMVGFIGCTYESRLGFNSGLEINMTHKHIEIANTYAGELCLIYTPDGEKVATMKQKEESHFNPSVPQLLRDKMLEVAGAIKDDFISDCGQGESHGCNRLEPIYGNPYPGFIPFQNGGYEISEFYRHDIDSSYHFTEGQTQSANESQKNCYESFWHDHLSEKNRRDNDPELDKDFNYSDLDAYPDLQQKFEEYENEWFEPALLRCELWVSDGHHDDKPETIYCRVSLGYKDAPYYRSKYDETLFEFNMSIAEFKTISIEGFIAQLTDRMKKVA